MLFGGGGEYCYWGCYEDYFVGRLLPNGTPDAGFAANALGRTVVYDTALQPDGKVVGVGYVRQPDGKHKLQVFRLRPDGALDPTFGLGGLVLISDGTDSYEIGQSVIVDPDGRIVVAGRTRQVVLLVARLAGERCIGFVVRHRRFLCRHCWRLLQAAVARAPGGGYRVMTGLSGGACGVVGLTDSGALDARVRFRRNCAGTGIPATSLPIARPSPCRAMAGSCSGAAMPTRRLRRPLAGEWHRGF